MNSSSISAGTERAPRFIDGPAEYLDDTMVRQRFFLYRVGERLISGKVLNMMVSFDQPASVVWPLLKDLNLWQNEYGHYFTGVLGDLEGQTFRMSDEPNDGGPHQYMVTRVIPEYLIELKQFPSDEDAKVGLMPDTHIFLVNDFGSKTYVTIMMQHASFTDASTEEEALEYWRTLSERSHHKFRKVLFPKLRALIAEAVGEGSPP